MSAPVGMTWGSVHVGDTVRGAADARTWVVCERHAGLQWLGSGDETARFVLSLGERRVTITRKIAEPAPVISAADHRAMAAAAGAIFSAMPDTRFVEETAVTATPTVIEMFHPDSCPHPSERRSALKNGVTRCTACGTDSVDGHEVDAQSIVSAIVERVAPLSALPAPVDPFAAPVAPLPPRRQDAPMGKWGWYKLPHPITGEPDALLPRVSTIAKTLSDTFALEAWKMRMVAHGVALHPDLIAGAAAAKPDTDKATLDEIAKKAMERAEASRGANLGTAMHTFCERLDDGESVADMRVPEALRADVEAYAAALKAAGLRVVGRYTERVIVNVEHWYAGRIDRVVEDRAGALHILDLKTGKDIIEYGGLELGAQQGCYANATHMAAPDFSGYLPMPAVDLHKAFILHLPIGKAAGQVYALDIVKGWRAARAAMEAREMRKDARNGWLWAYAPGTPADAVKLRIGRSASVEELARAAADARRIEGAWSPELEAYALARYDLVRACTAQTTDELAALWAELEPAGRYTQEVAAAAQARFAEINAQSLVTA